ncbi:MAG: FG-GAP-like repeat-containing protein [Deltaproteobacteria bacterium]|nr:FG-GAP-like repeat-containing protein [Myxococcales bacterium]MDP3217241.1 FG-GAP-like repeat-containing protein [Deltaproteobacteria bacterium]
MGSVAGCFGVLMVVACASACTRDNWIYDPGPEVDAGEVTADVPTTDIPTTDVPTTDVPTTDVPTIDVPVTDVPATDVPATDVPAADAPATDAPATDVSVIDVPATDVPVIDVPVIDVPAIDVPVIDASTDVPGVDVRADAAIDAPVPDVVTSGALRPIAPISLGEVTLRRPTLRWHLPSGYDGAVVDLCRDRACTMIIETRMVTGSSMQPAADLPARSVVFWRLRGRRGATTDAAYSPTWLFHVPATSASAGVDTSANPHFDVNGDGVDDLVIAARWATVRSLAQMGVVSVYHGSRSGVAAVADRVLESPGTTGGFAFGFAVANAGDVNGDGYADLVVGATGGSPGGLGLAGEAYVFHGSAAGIGATAARILGGAARGNEFGRAVAGAGDVNGDGYADIVVGEPYADPGGRMEAGAARVFLGSAEGVSAVAARVFNGALGGDLFGVTVAGAGDINGDGYDDVLVGAPYANVAARNDTGAVSVFLGSATGVGESAERVIEGAAAEEHFGSSIASAGDLNGDGYDDVVFGASTASPGGLVSAGTASVFHGGMAGLSAGAVRVLTGAAGDALGSAVAGAGDVNGDGYDDLAVGAQRGIVRVFHGGAAGVGASAARELSGPGWNSLSVAGAGDVNGDGYDDLIVGTPSESSPTRNFDGAAHVFIGSASGIGATAVTVYEGAGSGDAFGNAVASWWRWQRPGARVRRGT